jgi:hypothetical protein
MSVALTTTHENPYFRRSIPPFSSTALPVNPRIDVFRTLAKGTPTSNTVIHDAHCTACLLVAFV